MLLCIACRHMADRLGGNRLIHPYAINAVMALYIGIMQSPLRWSVPTDLALMRSIQPCLEQSRDPAAGSRFRSLMAWLTEAMERSEAAAQRRNHPERLTPMFQGQDQLTPPQRPTPSTQSTGTWSLIDQSTKMAAPDNFSSASAAATPSVALDLVGGSSSHQDSGDNWVVTPAPSHSSSTPSFLADAGNMGLPVDVSGLQLGDFFGDHSTAWNTQLWPLMGDGGGSRDCGDPTIT